ncbi:MAG: hypothetical protein H7Z72_25550 [Bacteroidetes bacterium]|nr:hypothetical protein [Fibrella sp.]
MNLIVRKMCWLWCLMSLLLTVGGVYAGSTMSPSDSSRTGRQPSVNWPIDAKVDTVLKTINTSVLTKGPLTKMEQQHRQQAFMALFAPSGYFVVMLPNKTELWVSAGQFLARVSRTRGVRYHLLAAKVIHFQDAVRNRKGEYSSRAVIYFDVSRFDNHVPVTQTTSRVTIPLSQPPPAADYWQIYELKVVEVNNLLAAPR